MLFRSNESLVLSDILGSASEEYHRLIHTKKSLTSVPVHELLSTLARRAKDRLDIECHVPEASDREQVSIQADPFILITSLLLILDQLKHETGLMEFSGSFKVKNKIVFLDISWEGDPLSSTLIHLWESMEIDTRNQSSPILLKDVLNQHQSALWLQAHQDPGAANTEGTPCVRFFMPLDETYGSFEQVMALPESRNLLMDMEMFDHSDQTLALDNRLLTELSYTTLIREINQASNLEQIIGKHSQLPRLIHSMLTGGTKVKTVTWLITAFSDAILNKLLEFALADLGPPPTAFAFITLGSEGRKEQTLKTDQDNAIIFKDPEPPESI